MIVLDRFWDQVARIGAGPDDCWEWRGSTTPNGYPLFWLERRYELAHRLVVGAPKGSIVDHLCNHPRCVRPEHLRVGTQRENLMRSDTALAAINARKVECVNGHALTGENLYVSQNGRACRICRLAASQRHRENKKVKR